MARVESVMSLLVECLLPLLIFLLGALFSRRGTLVVGITSTFFVPRPSLTFPVTYLKQLKSLIRKSIPFGKLVLYYLFETVDIIDSKINIYHYVNWLGIMLKAGNAYKLRHTASSYIQSRMSESWPFTNG